MLRYLIITVLVMTVPAFAGSDDLEDINFPLNSSIVVDGFQGLDMLAKVMAKHANLDLTVIGHTDSIGTAPYNKRLSDRRAESVKAYLVSKGVAAGKINTRGDGVSNSFDNATREGRFQNRRVSLELFETVNGSRSKVNYPRLLELFFGESEAAPKMMELAETAMGNQDAIMKRLSELEKQHAALAKDIQDKLDDMQAGLTSPSSAPAGANATPHMSKHFSFGNYSGISVGVGADDDGDLTSQFRGLYFNEVGNDFAVQAQVDWSSFETQNEGQADIAFVYQKDILRAGVAGSYKWISQDGFESARVAQGAVMADFLFDGGNIGVFGTVPIADGDVIAETPLGGAFFQETYVHLPTQVGLNFGASLTQRVALSGHAGILDGKTDTDFTAGLTLDVGVAKNLIWYLDAQLNDTQINNDDSSRYLTGIKLGSWVNARPGRSDQMTPINIPRIRYEILTRTVRQGNTAPVADAGGSRDNVPAGIVNLDGTGSFDPDGDALTYEWRQTGGPSVAITSANLAKSSFTGVAGESYSFELRVTDSLGELGRDTININMEAAPIPEPTVVSFLATPSTITEGELANLTWTTTDATSVTISGFGEVPGSGQVVVSPTETTEYTLTATNESGTVTATTTITVNPVVIPDAVISFFGALPASISEGENSELSWATINADTVTLSGIGQVPASGSVRVTPAETTTYTLTASNASGTITAETTITVNPIVIPEPVIDFFTAAPVTIQEGGFSTLNWSVRYADTVEITELGQVGPSGSLIISPTSTTTYTLTATNTEGSATATVTVTVEPVDPPNRAPIANAGPDQTLRFPGTATLDGTGSSDPDGDALNYQWQQLAGGTVTLSGADTATPSFTAESGSYVFRLTVTDARGLSASDEVTIKVVSFKRVTRQ